MTGLPGLVSSDRFVRLTPHFSTVWGLEHINEPVFLDLLRLCFYKIQLKESLQIAVLIQS